jgi:hypothetical protein
VGDVFWDFFAWDFCHAAGGRHTCRPYKTDHFYMDLTDVLLKKTASFL